MPMTDPIADFLTHIRNAMMRKHAQVSSPGSRVKTEIARVLKQEGFIEDWSSAQDDRGHLRIVVDLKYDSRGDSVIRGLKRVSTPGLRRHQGYKDMMPVYNGQGIAILTTSQGMMTDLECREKKIGGELICQVW
ncbi:MAG: 30S ribosomal protein S8 [Deltaproteobacteria bacterium]|nr:30S ribosomal protein S8 [Deltaproteobacteria bacterium]